MEPRSYPSEQHRPMEAEPRRPMPSRPASAKDRYWLHLTLFVLTLVCTILAGAVMTGRFLLYEEEAALFTILGFGVTESFLLDGLRFGGSLMLFLTVHEFGHYFAARYHRIKTSLPYYIPLPISPIGTLGAVIRIREPIPSLRKLFDIGAAGPLAGFVVALGILLYGLWTLPPPTYVLDLPGHEVLKDYVLQHGSFPDEMPQPGPNGVDMVLVVGETPLYWFLTQFFDHVPPMYEMYHYPYLFAGWLGLFFTALNLLPVGQLDGGHVLYALVGKKWHHRLARGFVVLLLLSGAVGYVNDLAPLFYEIELFAGHAFLAETAAWMVLALIVTFFLNSIFDRDLWLIVPCLLSVMLFAAMTPYLGPVANVVGYYGWFIWCLLIVWLIRTEHPPVLYYEPLSPTRRALGILNIIIFILCFSLKPFYVV